MERLMTDPKHNIDTSLGHEHRDVNLRSIMIFGSGLTVFVVIVYFVLRGMFIYLERRPKATDSFQSVFSNTSTLPPEPRLQTTPAQDLKEIRKEEGKVLDSYGWIDREGGIVRIPIQRSIELLTQRGLPSRPQKKEEKTQ
jgi:hypothetical protein